MSEPECDTSLRRKARSLRSTDYFRSRAGGYHSELADQDYSQPTQQQLQDAREYRQAQAFEANCHNRVLRALGSLTTNEAKAEFVEQVEALVAQFQEEPNNNG